MMNEQRFSCGQAVASSFIRRYVILGLISSAPLLLGQVVPASHPPSENESQGMRQIVDEVTLDLAVQDKKHHKVLDLKPDDILITDNDVPVKVNTFQLVHGDAQTD